MRRKRPSLQFYPGDWLRDAALRSVSFAARGLWIDLLCLMHDGDPYGHLAVNGAALSPATVAQMVGAAPKVYAKLFAELAAAGIPSTRPDGMVYSRRLVRDAELSHKRATAGAEGWRARYGGLPGKLPGQDAGQVARQVAGAFALAAANSSTQSEISTGGGGGPGEGSPVGRLVTALGRDPDRFTVMALFEALPPEESPDTWSSVLLGCLQGLGLAEGKEATVRQLAVACLDYPTVAKGNWSPAHFRKCVDRVIRGDTNPPPKRGAKPDPISVAQAWAKKEGA